MRGKDTSEKIFDAEKIWDEKDVGKVGIEPRLRRIWRQRRPQRSVDHARENGRQRQARVHLHQW